jgi:CubicO group peptidase (beta-lactamase class C family)
MASPIIVSGVELTPAALDGVFERLANDAAQSNIPLVALAVGDDRGLIRKQVVGADADRGRGRARIDEESLFFLASVTKPIFATAFMQLVEEGAVELDTPVARWLPGFDVDAKRSVTVRHLLSHTSGVPDALPELIRQERPSAAKLTRLALEAPLRFEPGTHWEYTSSTYYLLGQIAQRVAGQAAWPFLRKRLLQPLGMRDTAFDPRRLGRTIVPVHGVGADNFIKRFFLLRFVVALAHPGGGLWATLDDLVRFGAGLLAPRQEGGRWLPISPETFALMGEDHARGVPAFSEGGRPIHHGLGWGKPTMNAELPGSQRTVDHGGATGTRIWIDPEARLVFVYFTNQWAADRTPEFTALAGIYRALGQAPRSAGEVLQGADARPVGG